MREQQLLRAFCLGFQNLIKQSCAWSILPGTVGLFLGGNGPNRQTPALGPGTQFLQSALRWPAIQTLYNYFDRGDCGCNLSGAPIPSVCKKGDS